MPTKANITTSIVIPALLIASAAIADSDTGTLKASDPKWDRPSTNILSEGIACFLQTNDSINDQVPHDVYYIRALTASTLMDVTVTSLEPNPIDLDLMIAIYCGDYDINDPLTNLDQIDDDSAGYPNPAVLGTSFLDPDIVYTVVVSSYSSYAPSLNGDYRIELGPDLYFSTACLADISDDGNVDFFDISTFLTLYNSSNPIADFNHDGNLDFFDISAFLTAFSAGCP